MRSPTRFATTAMVVAILAASLTGCSSDPPDHAGSSADSSMSSATSTQSPEAGYDGPTIPAGVYTKTFDKAHVDKLGLTGVYDGGFNADGASMVVYKFDDGTWSESSGGTDRQLEVGSHGEYTFAHDGDLVLNETCCGDTELTWSLEGDQLTLKAVGPDAALADPMTKLMRDGTYTRTS